MDGIDEEEDDAGSSLAAEAGNPNTAPTRLRAIFDNSDYETQRIVAGNENCDDDMQKAFVAIDHGGIRSAVAHNRNLSPNYLALLADDDNEWVRAGVAENESAPEDILRKLATDESVWVRQHVAENANTPTGTLEILANDLSEDVQKALAKNPSLTVHLLEHLFARESGYRSDVHRHLAANASSHLSLLKELSESHDWLVRQAVAGHARCSVEIASSLAKDDEMTVRKTLAENTPFDEVLKLLAVDPEPEVRAASYENPAASEATRASAALIGLPAIEADE